MPQEEYLGEKFSRINVNMKSNHGFTLIELLVVASIIGILLAIAYPRYTEYVSKSRRADGRAAVMSISQSMERYYTENASYSSAQLSASSTIGHTTSDQGYYTLAFDNAPTSATVCGTTTTTSPDGTSYRICATPTGAQTGDSCGTLSISSTGVKAASTSNCW